jgi:hypothetical protein
VTVAGPAPEQFEVSGLAGETSASLTDLRNLKNGYVFEMLDIRGPRQLRVHVLVLNPRSYTLSEPFQSTLTPTEDNTVVAEENGLIVREITLDGTFGIKDKRATGFQGAQGQGASISGNSHFKDLRNFFREYSRRKKDPRESAFVRMVFHCIKDDDHFIVVPRSFETPRDARSTRMHYEYRISLAAIAVADGTTLRIAPSEDGFDFFANELRSISNAFNDARAAFSETTANLSAIKRKVGNIQAVMIEAAGIINAAGNMLSGATALIDAPLRAVASGLESIANASDRLADAAASAGDPVLEDNARSLRRMEAAIDQIAAFPERFGPSSLERTKTLYDGERGLTSDDIENDTGGASLGSKTRLAVGSVGRELGLDLGAYRGVQRIRITRADSIEAFAGRFSAPPELIILINDLRFPYIAEGGGPGILAPGELILIPVREGLATTTASPSNEYLTVDEALYGVDLALDPVLLAKGKLEIRVDEAHDRFDADLSRGLPNLVQGLEIVIRTERSTTTFLPDIGIRRSVGVKGTLQHVMLSAIVLREAILSDPRIEGIQESRIVLNGDVLTQEITPVVATERRAFTLVLPFGTAAGVGG